MNITTLLDWLPAIVSAPTVLGSYFSAYSELFDKDIAKLGDLPDIRAIRELTANDWKALRLAVLKQEIQSEQRRLARALLPGFAMTLFIGVVLCAVALVVPNAAGSTSTSSTDLSEIKRYIVGAIVPVAAYFVFHFRFRAHLLVRRAKNVERLL